MIFLKRPLSHCTGENDLMGSSMIKWQKGVLQTWPKGCKMEGNLWFWTSRPSFWTPFVVFLMDGPIGSFSPVQGAYCMLRLWGRTQDIQAKSGICGNLFVIFVMFSKANYCTQNPTSLGNTHYEFIPSVQNQVLSISWGARILCVSGASFTILHGKVRSIFANWSMGI